MTRPLLSCRALRVRRGARFALEVPALDLMAGSVTALWGHNGSGKSTLLLACAGLLDVEAGQVALDGGAVHGGPAPAPLALRRQVVLVMQEPYLLRGDVAHNLDWGLRLRDLPRTERQDRVTASLQALGLGELARRDVRQLSGGQRTLVAVARALALRPRVLLLDEVTRDLDAARRQDVVKAVQACAAAGSAVLLASHDRPLVDQLTSRCLRIENGQLTGADLPPANRSQGPRRAPDPAAERESTP